MSKPNARSRWKPYRVSIVVAASVGSGFYIGYMGGAGFDAVLRSALILASVMVVFFGAATVWESQRNDRENDKKNR